MGNSQFEVINFCVHSHLSDPKCMEKKKKKKEKNANAITEDLSKGIFRQNFFVDKDSFLYLY